MSLTGYAGVAMGILEYVFMSGTFSIIFAISLRGCGLHTKTASALMTAAVSGGAVIPVIQNLILQYDGVRYSFCIVTAIFTFGAIFPIYLNFFRAAKNQVDPVVGGHHRTNLLKRNSQAPESQKKGKFSGLNRRGGKRLSDVPRSEHVESSTGQEAAYSNAAKVGRKVDRDV